MLKKFKLFVSMPLCLLMAVCVAVFACDGGGGVAFAALDNLDKVDDIVKEVTHGDLEIKKHSLLFFKQSDLTLTSTILSFLPNYDNNTEIKNGSKELFTDWVNGVYSPNNRWKDGTVYCTYTPAVTHKLYNNGKKILMYPRLNKANSSNRGTLSSKLFFDEIGNNRTIADNKNADADADALAQSVARMPSQAGSEHLAAMNTPTANSYYGSAVLDTKGINGEVFVSVQGIDTSNNIDIRFFAVSSDAEGNVSGITELTDLNFTRDYAGTMAYASVAAGDFDSDGYKNEFVLLINTRTEVLLYVYRLFIDPNTNKLTVKSLGDATGIQVYKPSRSYGTYLTQQATGGIVAGDFNGDGSDEIGIIYKTTDWTDGVKTQKTKKAFVDGAEAGKVVCAIYKWDPNNANFYSRTAVKSYHDESFYDVWYNPQGSSWVSGVCGLNPVAADTNGDGKDEIIVLTLGYSEGYHWTDERFWYEKHDFHMAEFLTRWYCDTGINPKHDDVHVKGSGVTAGPLLAYGSTRLFPNSKNNIDYDLKREYQQSTYLRTRIGFLGDEVRAQPDEEKEIKYQYAKANYSIAAGPLTGRFGKGATADDIAVAWTDPVYEYTHVVVFKSKVNASGQFDGFENGKEIFVDRRHFYYDAGWTWLLADDFAGEGVLLDKPVHLKKNLNRSYIAVLDAVPYHVDTLAKDAKTLQSQPYNFTYSHEGSKTDGGRMEVYYGSSTTTNDTNKLDFDLSESVETMFLFDSEAKHGGTFSAIKGAVSFATKVGDVATKLSNAFMASGDRQATLWQPTSPIGWLNDVMDFVTDKVENVKQQSKTTTTTKTFTNNIQATVDDAYMFGSSSQHIWRYPVLTRPVPRWLAMGTRVDTSPLSDDEAGEDQELFITLSLMNQPETSTLTSKADSMYQPTHEEGNLFSYTPTPQTMDGFSEGGSLSNVKTWAFSTANYSEQVMFEKASEDMEHTEKLVQPSTFSQLFSAVNKLASDKGAPKFIPDSENPKTFTKKYSKSEYVGYRLRARDDLQGRGVGYTVLMQPYVSREGAMVFGTGVRLYDTAGELGYVWNDGLYNEKPDPALLLPHKFTWNGTQFDAETNDSSAMRIRGMKFYMPRYAAYTNNGLVNGETYEISVPLYNASFKDANNFDVRLSYSESNSPTAKKTAIQTVKMSLGGWRDDKDNNKGVAKFTWKPELKFGTPYYFYVEIDPSNNLSEVHEARYQNGKLSDYGGNNTGFYPFSVLDPAKVAEEASRTQTVTNSRRALHSVAYGRNGFKIAEAGDSDNIKIDFKLFNSKNEDVTNNFAGYMKTLPSNAVETIHAQLSYSDKNESYLYAFLVGATVKQSAASKISNPDSLTGDDIDKVFLLQDMFLFDGQTTDAYLRIPKADIGEEAVNNGLILFDVGALTAQQLLDIAEELDYIGEDPVEGAEAEVNEDAVSTAVSETYNLSNPSGTLWVVSEVNRVGVFASASDDESNDDDSKYLDITLSSDVEGIAYGQDLAVTVTTIPNYTPKGEYKIVVQKLEDSSDNWVTAETLTFDAADDESSGGNDDSSVSSHSGSSGCTAGMSGLITLIILSGFALTRKK
ncbi:MAG: hypothetical protein IJ667_08225 [Synergistaceae bacterium]|nr:hypothetical protein [Synergistaceae bacterium]